MSSVEVLSPTATPAEVLVSGDAIRNYFDIAVDPAENLTGFTDALNQLNPRFQGERELVRWELEADQTTWPDGMQELVMRSATRMRMLEAETPLDGFFDVAIVLGAARQANLDRARYAAVATTEGGAHVARLILAGSTRELVPEERVNVANYAPNAAKEFDLVKAAKKVISRKYSGLPIVTSHRVADPKAGTPEVIQDVLSRLDSKDLLPANPTVAAITTQIYQLSASLDLGRVGARFESAYTLAAGNPSDPEIVKRRTVATYWSEVLRTLRAAANAQYGE